MTLVVVGVAGALGAIARYVATGWVQGVTGGFYPWGTFVVNVCGCLALGFAMSWLQTAVASAELRQFVAIGFLGSFTTFSTFSYEALAMLRDGEWWGAGTYIVGSVVLGVLAALLGMGVAQALPGR